MTYKIIFNDVMARRADYKHLEDNEVLMVGEPFRTLQGEGPKMGMPCVFVRLAGCNLGDKSMGCAFCDTDFRLKNGKVWSHDEILLFCSRLWTYPAYVEPLIVLTGGEPTLQPTSLTFIREAILKGWHVQVETNGYFLDHNWSDVLRTFPESLTVVCSPKTNIARRFPTMTVEDIAAITHFKFLIEDDPESPYYDIPQWAKDLYGSWREGDDELPPVFLTPMAYYLREDTDDTGKKKPASVWDQSLIDQPRTSRNYTRVSKLCSERGYRMSTQMHLFGEIF